LPPRLRAIPAMATALLLCLLPLRRRRYALRLLLLLFAFAAALAVSGCGSDTASTANYVTPTGTYSIVVSATDGTITTTAPVTLTVLPGTYQ